MKTFYVRGSWVRTAGMEIVADNEEEAERIVKYKIAESLEKEKRVGDLIIDDLDVKDFVVATLHK